MLVSDQYHAWYNNTVSVVQHIISGPVRVISGITFASGSLLRSYMAYPAQNSPPHKTAFHDNAGATMTEESGVPHKVGLKKKK